jgi:hypothetical protein
MFSQTPSACYFCRGAAGFFPLLNGSPSGTIRRRFCAFVLSGALSVGSDKAPTAPTMSAFSWVLNDDQAAVVTYIRNAWGNAAPTVSASQVSRPRH